MSHEKFNFTLLQSRMVTPRVLQMTLRRSDGQAFSYIPGQFITLHLPHESTELRRCLGWWPRCSCGAGRCSHGAGAGG